MNEPLTIGQLEVTGSNAVRAGAKPEIQVHAILEGMLRLLTRCTSLQANSPAKWNLSMELLIARHRGASPRELSEAGDAVSLGESETRMPPFDVQNRRIASQNPEQPFVYHPGDWEQKDETYFPTRSLLDRCSNQKMEWHSSSLSDWAKWVVVTRPDQEHLSGFAGSFRLRTSRIASFVGRAAAVSGDVAYVTLLDESTGERFEAECESALLQKRGIREGGEFLCTVTRKGEQTVVEFSALPPKVLTEGQLAEISREVDSRLK